MKELNEIDKLFEQGLGSAQQAPPAEVWEGIAAEMAVLNTTGQKPKESGRKGRFLLLAALLLLLSGSTVVYFTNFHNAGNTVQPLAEKTAINNIEVDQQSKAAPSENGSVESAAGTIANNEKVEANTIDPISTSPTSISNNNISSSNAPIVGITTAVSADDDSDENTSTSPETVIPEDPEIPISGKTNKLDFTRLQSVAVSIELRDIPLPELPEPEYVEPPEVDDNDPINPNVPKRNPFTDPIYTIGFNAGPEYMLQTGSNLNQDLLNPGITVFTGIKPNRDSRFNVIAGVGYSMSHDKSNWEMDYFTIDSVGNYLDVVDLKLSPVYNNGMIVGYTVSDTIYNSVAIFDTVYHLAEMTSNSKHHYLHFPVLVEYRFAQTRKFEFLANAGVVFNYRVGQLDAERPVGESDWNIVDIREVTDNRRNFYMQYQLGVNTSYKLTDNLLIDLGAACRFTPTSVYDEILVTNSTEPASVVLHTGLRYNF